LDQHQQSAAQTTETTNSSNCDYETINGHKNNKYSSIHHHHQNLVVGGDNEIGYGDGDILRAELTSGVGYWTREGELIFETDDCETRGRSLSQETNNGDVDSNCEEYEANDYPDEDEEHEHQHGDEHEPNNRDYCVDFGKQKNNNLLKHFNDLGSESFRRHQLVQNQKQQRCNTNDLDGDDDDDYDYGGHGHGRDGYGYNYDDDDDEYDEYDWEQDLR